MSSFVQACCRGDVDIVSRMLHHQDYRTEDLNAGLLNACKDGHLEVVQELLKNGAEVDYTDRQHICTGLMFASMNGYADIVKFLLECGANVNHRDKGKNTALHKSCFSGHLDITQMLVAAGADVSAVSKHGDTALIRACWNGHTGVARYLLEHGVDVNQKNKFKETPMYVASYGGYLDTVKYLVQHRPRIALDSEDLAGDTGLMRAARQGHAEVVRFLLEHGSNGNHSNISKETALQMASCEHHLSVVKALCEGGADMDFADKDGETSLIKAAKMGHLNVAAYLVEQGASLDLADNNGATPLMHACRCGRVNIIDYLLKSEANVNIRSFSGKTALHECIEFGNKSLPAFRTKVRIISSSVRLEIQEKMGEMRGIMESLINAGAHVDVPDSEGKTAVDYLQEPCILLGDVISEEISLISGQIKQQFLDCVLPVPLKCLAAQVLTRCGGIQVAKYIPRQMVTFVELHAVKNGDRGDHRKESPREAIYHSAACSECDDHQCFNWMYRWLIK